MWANLSAVVIVVGHGFAGKIASWRGKGRTLWGGASAGPLTVDAGGRFAACVLLLMESTGGAVAAVSAMEWAKMLEFPWALLAGLSSS